MKIHSSSIAYYPADIKPLPSAQSSHVLNKDKQQSNQTNEAVFTPEQFGKELDKLEFLTISNTAQNAINMRTQKALTAYIDSANQSRYEQRSRLASIDFYV